ncbi:NAD(P)-binding domain-containing protein [Pararhizobium sp. YC-54]|uniref:pyrroline-5-carboxylate reductase family protein n=1 Tax=Pararhizobium sp. YC-54 TaxID=2986920 RepID=UPI0021F7DFC9|nr:pyrroline-5-carboxylate reductase dimerization domain-containing protein [Pararhizobium sp. YC-54]MCV9996631.1 NAD(P)-binding domain-containing protein [Pararhizobium sp. YC-54]
MTEQLNIGIVGAAGWLGRAFASSIIDAGVAAPESLALSYRSKKPDLLPEAAWVTDNQELFDRSDVVIISVRPHDLGSIKMLTSGKLIISVMAGVTLQSLAQQFKTQRVVRALPNGAAEVRRSYTPWAAADGITSEDRDTVLRILEACGTADEVSTEADIDYLTGLTGSGPAFPALLAAAMMNDAVSRGIKRSVARRAVNAVLVGTGRLVERRSECPSDIVETFMEYRGTTAAALDTMRAAGFETAVRSGLEAAFQKSVSMGQSS